LVEQLSDLGCSVELQDLDVATEQGGFVANIVGLLPGAGTPAQPALLVMAHYDSRPGGSLGAGDDGSGVAAILEALRALRAAPDPALDRDLIILFTDAEELGLHGARAFLATHPHARNLGLALNFEARGVTGPSLLFQTSPGNARLVEAFAAAPRPMGNSLAATIYRALPNDTDLTPFLQADIPGLNFAFIAGLDLYHTPLDDLDHLDPRSVQHQADYVLSLLKHFGRTDLAALRSADDAVFFPLPTFAGTRLIVYPESWALPLALLVLGSVLALGTLALIRRSARPSALLRAAAALLAALLAAPLAGGLAWLVLGRVAPHVTWTSHQDVFFAATILLGCAVVWTIAHRPLAACSEQELSLALAFLSALLGLAVACLVPGASYLFAWPALGMLLPLADLCLDHPRLRAARHALMPLGSIPLVLLWLPTLLALFHAFSLTLPAFLVLTAAWIVAQALPLLRRIPPLPVHRWAFAAAAGLMVAASLIPDDLAAQTSRFKAGYQPRWPGTPRAVASPAPAPAPADPALVPDRLRAQSPDPAHDAENPAMTPGPRPPRS
jgi:hypothetical protein